MYFCSRNRTSAAVLTPTCVENGGISLLVRWRCARDRNVNVSPWDFIESVVPLSRVDELQLRQDLHVLRKRILRLIQSYCKQSMPYTGPSVCLLKTSLGGEHPSSRISEEFGTTKLISRQLWQGLAHSEDR